MNPGSSIAFQRPTSPGAGLLVATLLSALLATAAAVLIEAGRNARAAVSEQHRIESARLQADGIVAAAIVAMDAGDSRLSLDGRASHLPSHSAGFLSLQDTNGLVDINIADPAVMAALLRSEGLAEDEAAALARSIADWRHAKGDGRSQATGERDYSRVGRPRPGRGPFTAETELADVAGVSPALLDCLLPHITVFSTADQVDPAVAPQRLRELLNLPHLPGGGIAFGPPVGHVVLITAAAPVSRNAAIRSRQWVRLTGEHARPFVVHRAAVDLVPWSKHPQMREGCGAASRGETV